MAIDFGFALPFALALSVWACGDEAGTPSEDGGSDASADAPLVYYDGYDPLPVTADATDDSDDDGYSATSGYGEEGGYPAPGDFSYDGGGTAIDASPDGF